MTFTRSKARAITLAAAFVQDGIPFTFHSSGGRYRFLGVTGPDEEIATLEATKGHSGYRSMSVTEIVEGLANEQATETAQEAEQSDHGDERGIGADGHGSRPGGEHGHPPGDGGGTDSRKHH